MARVAGHQSIVPMQEDAASCSGLNIEMATRAKIHNRGSLGS